MRSIIWTLAGTLAIVAPALVFLMIGIAIFIGGWSPQPELASVK